MLYFEATILVVSSRLKSANVYPSMQVASLFEHIYIINVFIVYEFKHTGMYITVKVNICTKMPR